MDGYPSSLTELKRLEGEMKKIVLGALAASIAMPTLADSNMSLDLMMGEAIQDYRINNDALRSDESLSVGIRSTYSLSQHLGLEFGYMDYGEADLSYLSSDGEHVRDNVSTTALNVGIKWSTPFRNGVSIHARGGVSYWDMKVESTFGDTPSWVAHEKDNGNNMYFGAGAQYELSKNMRVGIEYTVTDIDASLGRFSTIDNKVKSLVTSLSVSF